jgi:hypothetical protein
VCLTSYLKNVDVLFLFLLENGVKAGPSGIQASGNVAYGRTAWRINVVSKSAQDFRSRTIFSPRSSGAATRSIGSTLVDFGSHG